MISSNGSLLAWFEVYKKNIRPATQVGYKGNITNHINPVIGHYQISQLNPRVIDEVLIPALYKKGLSNASVRYIIRTLSVALKSAKIYGDIESNPVQDILTKFSSKNGPTPDPYTLQELQALLANVTGTKKRPENER